MRRWIAVSMTSAAIVVTTVALSTSRAAEEARSRLVGGRAVATNYSITIADFQDLAEAAKKKHGPQAKTVMQGGAVTTTVNGKVVETATLKARVIEVFGMLMAGPRRNEMARFPFHLRVSGKGEPTRDIGEIVRTRFAKSAPELFDFNDFDWVNLWCWPQPSPRSRAEIRRCQPAARQGRALPGALAPR